MREFKGIFWYIVALGSFLYFSSMLFIMPGYSFNIVFLAFSIFALAYAIALTKYKDNNLFKKANKVIKILITLAILIIIIAGGIMSSAAIKKNTEKSDYLIVLGAGLLNGDQISKTLKHRLDATLEYLKDNDNGETIIVSGGKGSDEKISEAEAMKRYLINNGIKENRILMEDKSTSTFENFKFSKEVIEKNSEKEIEKIKIKIFTNGFHMFRSNFLSKRVGFKEVTNYSGTTPWYLIPSYYSREFLAIGKSFVLDK